MEMISKAIVDGSLEALKEEKPTRKEVIKEEYGQRAQQVQPYKPNRKQLRAQKAAKRKQKVKTRSK